MQGFSGFILYFLFLHETSACKPKYTVLILPIWEICGIDSKSFYPTSYTDKNGKYGSYSSLLSSLSWNWRACGLCSTCGYLWNPEAEERMLHLGKRTRSKTSLLVGDFLYYTQFLALTNHFSFSSFGGSTSG